MADGHPSTRPGLRAATGVPPERWIGAGSGLAIVGVVVALTLEPTWGGITLLAGVAANLFGLHTLGRSGADD